MTKLIGQTKQGDHIAAWVMKCNPEVYNVVATVADDERARVESLTSANRARLAAWRLRRVAE